LYDQNFNLVRENDKINGIRFRPLRLNCSVKHLFIGDDQNDRILMTDFEFNIIESTGSNGNLDNQFNRPFGICLKMNYYTFMII